MSKYGNNNSKFQPKSKIQSTTLSKAGNFKFDTKIFKRLKWGNVAIAATLLVAIGSIGYLGISRMGDDSAKISRNSPKNEWSGSNWSNQTPKDLGSSSSKETSRGYDYAPSNSRAYDAPKPSNSRSWDDYGSKKASKHSKTTKKFVSKGKKGKHLAKNHKVKSKKGKKHGIAKHAKAKHGGKKFAKNKKGGKAKFQKASTANKKRRVSH